MIENGFAPFAPRRLHRNDEPAPAAIADVAAEEDDAQPIAPVPEPEPVATAVAEPVATGQDEVDDLDRPATNIRAAAIELAAAACARALRYAVDRNPRLLARFVDDALRAAGSPRTAVVRIAPLPPFVCAESDAHDFVADPALSPGDVFVDCEAGTLGATIEERAERLVRAAAS